MIRSVLALTLFVPAVASAAQWEIDPSHTTANFVVKHMMVANVRGEFGKVTGAANVDDKDITKSVFTAEIDASSINTREPKRDEHLKSPDFFEVAKFPKITFKSTKVEKAANGALKVTGDLTMRGVTKAVTLDVAPFAPETKDPWGNVKTGTTLTGKINRKDWGLNWNKALEAGGLLVAEEVALQIDVELNKKAPAKS